MHMMHRIAEVIPGAQAQIANSCTAGGSALADLHHHQAPAHCILGHRQCHHRTALLGQDNVDEVASSSITKQLEAHLGNKMHFLSQVHFGQ